MPAHYLHECFFHSETFRNFHLNGTVRVHVYFTCSLINPSIYLHAAPCVFHCTLVLPEAMYDSSIKWSTGQYVNDQLMFTVFNVHEVTNTHKLKMMIYPKNKIETKLDPLSLSIYHFIYSNMGKSVWAEVNREEDRKKERKKSNERKWATNTIRINEQNQ